MTMKQTLQMSEPEFITSAELCDAEDKSSTVVSQSLDWDIHINKDPYVSPTFYIGQEKEHEACIKAHNYNGTKNLSLSFVFISSVDKVQVGSVEFSLTQRHSNASNIIEVQRFSSESDQVLTFADILYNCSYLPVTLKITCCVKLKETKFSTYKEHNMKLIADYEALLESSVLTDVSIIVEKKTLSVHKTVLAARSPVFSAMFQTDMAEKRESRITIQDVSYKAMKGFINFMYTGKVPDLKESAEELLLAADKYGLDDLKYVTGEYLSRNVTTENAIRLMILGERHRHTGLRTSAVNYAKMHRMDVKNFEDWKKIKDSDPCSLLEAFMEI